jgi:type VI secretion system protein ImpC
VAPAVLIGDFEVDHSAEDLQLLGMLGAIGQRLHAPFVAAASPSLVGGRSFPELARVRDLAERHKQPEFLPWQQFRRLPQARWVGLTLPRLLSRLPYGAETDRVESFEFEEWTDASGHDDYTWGNGPLPFAALTAAAFGASGWELDLARQVHRLEGIPLHVYRRDGESVATPCAEIVMTDALIDQLRDAGFIPLTSYQSRDLVALPCVQSVSVPRAPLPVGVDG